MERGRSQVLQIDPLIFRTWLNILAKVPNSILWLLRFPAPGEAHLKQTATQWANEEVASRIVFTDVSPVRQLSFEATSTDLPQKQLHIARGRIGDLFLDSTEVRPRVSCVGLDLTLILNLIRSAVIRPVQSEFTFQI